jgi:hypothetical protein
MGLDLFHEQLGFAPGALDQERRERAVVGQYRLADQAVGALASTEDVFEPARFERRDGRFRDRA